MITVKEAAESAAQFARSVLDEGRTKDLRLEEVEMEKAPPRWFITLSMPANSSSPYAVLTRAYKTFTVDAETGEVLAMKIRDLAGAA